MRNNFYKFDHTTWAIQATLTHAFHLKWLKMWTCSFSPTPILIQKGVWSVNGCHEWQTEAHWRLLWWLASSGLVGGIFCWSIWRNTVLDSRQSVHCVKHQNVADCCVNEGWLVLKHFEHVRNFWVIRKAFPEHLC